MGNQEHIKNLFAYIEQEQIEFIDLRFSDIKGQEHHMSISCDAINEDFLINGKVFDASSLEGWKDISNSDMLLMPIIESSVIDPFYSDKTLNLRCNLYDPLTKEPYSKDPRNIAIKAEQYLVQSGIADSFMVGIEPEFFIFDDVRFKVAMGSSFYAIDSEESIWNSDKKYEDGNLGYRPRIKRGYAKLPPVDSSQNIRSEICLMLKHYGIKVEAHHHEVASSNQNEIICRFNSLTNKADEYQIYKYVVHNVAKKHNKSACFMPKPLYGDIGSGMHFHMSLFKNNKNIFHTNTDSKISQIALFFIGGIIKHAKALNAFTNSTTNSYKRLISGFEAPVLLSYSYNNRSASIRIPSINTEQSTRIEARFPDPMSNPYISFAAILMAGLDGIKNKIDPGEPIDKNLDILPEKIFSEEELNKIPRVAHSLEDALESLAKDHQFLLEGDVFSKDFIESYIKLKKEEVDRLKMYPHPLEFDMYYN